jgi:DNA helicase INO80
VFHENGSHVTKRILNVLVFEQVTVYRLICKWTVEEKIVKRANQKNTVQQLVMTGGHSQGDVFEAEEVVSLLLDDAELEQKMKEQLSRHRVCV